MRAYKLQNLGGHRLCDIGSKFYERLVAAPGSYDRQANREAVDLAQREANLRRTDSASDAG